MTDEELKQLVVSNSRAIQALTDNIAELTNDVRNLTDDVRTLAQESRQSQTEREELRRAVIGIANLLASLDDDRPTILRRLMTIENKVDRLLERREDEQS